MRMYLRPSTLEDLKADERGASKHLTPSHYGESIEQPELTMLLLRAWMLWRVSDDWLNQRESRKRQFAEDRDALKRDLLLLRDKQNGGLTGNAEADKKFIQWVPGLLAK